MQPLRAWYVLGGPRLELMSASSNLPYILGCTQQDLRGQGLVEMLHPEERAIAEQDFNKFLEAATLTGCVTRCRMMHQRTREYIVVEIATSVVSNGVVVGNLLVVSAPPGLTFEHPPAGALPETLHELSSLLQSIPISLNGTGMRAMAVLDAASLRVQLAWPMEYMTHLFCASPQMLLGASIVDLASPTDSPSVLRDIRHEQVNMQRDRLSRCYNRHAVSHAILPQYVECVMDFQDDCIVMIVQRFDPHMPSSVPPQGLLYANDPRFPLPGTMRLIEQQQQQAAAAAAAAMMHAPPVAMKGEMMLPPLAPAHLAPTPIRSHPLVSQMHFKKRCTSCGTQESPEWRKGPDGDKSLCNACGLRYSRSLNKTGPRRRGNSMEME